MTDEQFHRLQQWLPKRALTELAGWGARARGGALTTAAIRAFIRRYDVPMQEAAQADPAAYASFNDFFTRALKPGARPLAAADWVSPVDGAISQLGPITEGDIFQAKGQQYSATALLGGDSAAAARYRHGQFATLYLSPRDYHRIHMPAAGTLRRMLHVPGSLYSVNPATARTVPGLFARNERLVCHFDGAQGPWVLVLVGATIVGSMATVWAGTINPPRQGVLREWRYADEPAGLEAPVAARSEVFQTGLRVTLSQGAEMGRFMLGSTVVLLWPQDAPIRFEPGWVAEAPVRMGQAMARNQGPHTG